MLKKFLLLLFLLSIISCGKNSYNSQESGIVAFKQVQSFKVDDIEIFKGEELVDTVSSINSDIFNSAEKIMTDIKLEDNYTFQFEIEKNKNVHSLKGVFVNMKGEYISESFEVEDNYELKNVKILNQRHDFAFDSFRLKIIEGVGANNQLFKSSVRKLNETCTSGRFELKSGGQEKIENICMNKKVKLFYEIKQTLPKVVYRSRKAKLANTYARVIKGKSVRAHFDGEETTTINSEANLFSLNVYLRDLVGERIPNTNEINYEVYNEESTNISLETRSKSVSLPSGFQYFKHEKGKVDKLNDYRWTLQENSKTWNIPSVRNKKDVFYKKRKVEAKIEVSVVGYAY